MAKKSTEKTYRRLITRLMEGIARLPKNPENQATFEVMKKKIAKYAAKIEHGRSS